MSLLEMTRGDTTVFNVTLTDADDDPLDLATLAITFTATHPILTLTKTIGDGITITDEPGGLLDVTIDDIDTEDLEDRIVFAWDLQVSNGSTTHTPLLGSLIVNADVTP